MDKKGVAASIMQTCDPHICIRTINITCVTYILIILLWQAINNANLLLARATRPCKKRPKCTEY